MNFLGNLVGTLVAHIPSPARNAVLLAPTLFHLVRQAEEAFPGKGNGDQKKAVVLDAAKLLTSTLSQRGIISQDVHASVDGIAGELIDVIVDVMNAVKLFKVSGDGTKPEAAH